MLHIPPTNSLFLAAKQEPYKRKILKIFLERFKENGPAGNKKKRKKKKKERVIELGRRTREEMVK